MTLSVHSDRIHLSQKCCCTSGAEAGLAFEKLAQVHLKQDSRLEAASAYVEAAKAYQKTDKSGSTTQQYLLTELAARHVLTVFEC